MYARASCTAYIYVHCSVCKSQRTRSRPICNVPRLLYGLECFTLPKSSLRSLDFIVVRFLMKLFKTVNNEIIRECCSNFKFPLPSELLDKRRDKFQSNFMLCTGILHYFGIKT